MAMGVGPGDLVGVPAVTFFATAEAVVRVGATPVVVDVRADAPLLDAAVLPSGLRVVIAVHLFGEPCGLEIDVPVLDDSAQVAGAPTPIRTGNVAAASFYPTKTLGAAGDGGIVLADDPEVAAAARKLASHGMPRAYLHERVNGHVGANCRLDAVQAAVLLGHLPDLAARVVRRRAIAARYDAELPEQVRRLPRATHNPVHQYVVRVPERDTLAARLREAGVETAIYYPIPVSAQPALAGLSHPPTPNADTFCREALALPVQECLTDDEVDTVIALVRRLA